jgi:hypothetical protein
MIKRLSDRSVIAHTLARAINPLACIVMCSMFC